jgi:uncharacterized protein
MAEHFFDTSAAVKHYRAEVGTVRVDSLLADPASRNYLSTLGVFEMHSAFARLVRIGQITAAEGQRLRGRLLADIAGGLWQVVQVAQADFQQARHLLVRHATVRSLRTLDALQLAVALSLNALIRLDEVVCADTNLCGIITAEGMTALNPEVP